MPDTHGVAWRLVAGSGAGRTGAGRTGAPDVARDLARALAAEALGAAPGQVRLAHLCPSCGSGAHGRPVVLVAGRAHPEVHVSLSRTTGFAAVAVSRSGPLGIDVQAWDATDFAGFDAVAVHPGEPVPRTPRERARLWAAKEALLKLTGTGLERDPATLDLGRLASTLPGARLVDLPAPDGISLVLATST